MSEDLIRVIMMSLAILLPTTVLLFLLSQRGRGSISGRKAVEKLAVLFEQRAAELEKRKKASQAPAE